MEVKHDDISPQRGDDAKSSSDEGMLWPQAMAGVVGYARHPTTPCWLKPDESYQAFIRSLSKEGTFLTTSFTYIALL
jgi:hypothetical protein